MRNLCTVLSVFLSVFFYSQGSSNVFSDKEGNDKQSSVFNSSETEGHEAGPVVSADADDNPPNLGDPVPIDQYEGLLLLSVMAIILYSVKKKKHLLSDDH